MNKNITASLDLGNRFCFKLIRNILRVHHQKQNNCSTAVSTSQTSIYPKPVIPKRIERGPTDLLKALADTVHKDVNAPAYKFTDDPYLYAISNHEKRNYALSKESGRKAARWIRDNHAEYFNHQPDDPVIKEYLPKILFDENAEVTGNDLRTAIKNCQVSDAINMYRNLQSKNEDVSESTRQSLLELVSFYNCEDGFDPEWTEEFKTRFLERTNRFVKTWKDGGLAEELFQGLKETGIKPYCAIIKGMCAYYQVDNAWSLYQECLSNNLVPDTASFNALIRITPLLKEENEMRWELVQEFLHQMVELNVHPNLGTMNSVLEVLSTMRSWVKTRTFCLQVLAEFRRFGIEPSLASYYFLLRTYYTQRNASSPLLGSLLNEIEDKSFSHEDLKDTMFFHAAMDICKRDLQSFELAEKLNNLFCTGENEKFIGEKYKESSYYRNYMTLAVNSLPLEEFMRIYDQYVPHVYSPDREVAEEIVRVIGVYDDLSLLPRIWSDCILLEIARSEKLMEMTLMLMNNHSIEETSPELQKQLASIAWDIWTRVQNQNEKLRQKIEWSGQMLGDCMSVLTRCGDVPKVSEIVSTVDGNSAMVLGVIPLPSLMTFFDAALLNEMYKEAMMVTRYAKDCDYPESFEMAKRLSESAPGDIRSRVVSAFGSEIL